MKNDMKPHRDQNAKAESYKRSTDSLRFVFILAWLSFRSTSGSPSKTQQMYSSEIYFC